MLSLSARRWTSQEADADQELVTRTQAGDAGAFDDLVVKYTPRLYGLVYNMTSNHEDTNDLFQDIFAKAYKVDPRVPRQIVVLHLDSFHRGEHDAEFPQETRPPISTEPG